MYGMFIFDKKMILFFKGCPWYLRHLKISFLFGNRKLIKKKKTHK